MIKTKYDWKLSPTVVDTSFLKMAKKKGLDELSAQLLYARGVKDEMQLQSFLTPSIEDLHDPYLLQDMEKSVARIRQAIENGEGILIYGDYDADGMTSASIVKETLDELGAESIVYLPNRFTDGYGPNLSVYKYFIEQEGISLILTVDNGVAGHEAISYAQEQCVDVIVTDHHSLPAELPEAFAVVHPEHPDADYPFKHLAGCGVAFKLACALLDDVNMELLDLVAIGTIADMVSLTGENRILVKYGLEVLKRTQRLGLQELAQLAGLDLANLTEETVGFQIAPRLNALGRLDDPNPAIELLTGFDDEEARDIAQLIEDKNTERKAVVQAIYEEARTMVNPDNPVQVLAKEGWNPGVLGIVAGRLLEEFNQPVIVLNSADGLAKGSARSTEAVNMFEALSPHPELFVAFGGHAGAAGMTLEIDKLEDLAEVLGNFVKETVGDKRQKPKLFLDEALELSQLTLETIKGLDKLVPFGMDNRQPVFYLQNLKVVSARVMGQDNSHLKFRVNQAGTELDVVAFGQGSQVNEFLQVKDLELAVTLSVNQWNGNTSVQLMLVDARVSGVQLFDIRAKNLPIPAGVPAISNQADEDVAVVIDVPESLEILQDLFEGREFQAIYFKNDIKKAYYLSGYGTREQYAKFYKTIYQYPEFDVRYKLGELANYLKIPQILLVKMVQIFEELGFVTISDGVMTVNKGAAKRHFEESTIYQALRQEVKFQELMALGTVQEIYQAIRAKEVAPEEPASGEDA
ncbi:single-stranded-DNA-specific exonuclease RecJ [Streptococcus moroccensis]|uniref:Single-stranded-DNA-specific exonuclease RecJ n=1 Tax=Streptococcus moroccensis TaxID=1451356 RepID=A0ABT9YRT3_9STRE|nr:single-stranded-DNA-specific exonuclease RecJ [Streptococcus moroccensis]MDQ0222704.1 single-stranded-DNA-specific exonuclease [Streptococcus moroccensis]